MLAKRKDFVDLYGAVVLGVGLMAHVGSVHGESVASKVRQGNLRFDQKMYEQALQLYSEALQQRPERREINYNLANTLYRMDKHREAATELKKAAEAEDSTLRRKASYNLGNAMFKAGQFQEAVRQYSQVLQQDPGDMDAKYNLELALRKLEEQQKQKSQESSKDQKQNKSEQENQSQQGKDESKQDQSQSSPSQPQPQQEKTQPDRRDESRQAEDSRQRQDPKALSRLDAERLLQAMEAKEREELERQLQKVRRGAVRGRDW